MSYEIEQKPASSNGYFTPTEARNYYGRYSRDGVTIHWWGNGAGPEGHDNIVNYLNGKAANGQDPTVNYVLSDNKITLCINPDDVAWCSGTGNPTTVSVECQPTLGAEGYKKAGWLIWQLELRYGKTLQIWGHNHWTATQCPGTLDLNRMRAEADKWRAGGYNPIPQLPEWQANRKVFAEKFMYAAFDNTTLVNMTNMSAIKTFKLDDRFQISGETMSNGKSFWITTYSVINNQPNGFLKPDLKDTITPRVSPSSSTSASNSPSSSSSTSASASISPSAPPEPEYPNWFIDFWMKLFVAIKNILGIK
jgi:hypothetical protein